MFTDNSYPESMNVYDRIEIFICMEIDFERITHDVILVVKCEMWYGVHPPLEAFEMLLCAI